MMKYGISQQKVEGGLSSSASVDARFDLFICNLVSIACMSFVTLV
jgi:hypothetical protein